MRLFKNRKTGEVITEDSYRRLYFFEKQDYTEQSSNSSADKLINFGISAAIGVTTGSALLGGLLGGDFVGGIVGDMFDGDLMD